MIHFFNFLNSHISYLHITNIKKKNKILSTINFYIQIIMTNINIEPLKNFQKNH